MNTDELAAALFTAERRVLSIQAKLHCWARDDPHRRFDDLFNLVADPAFLLVAWDRVRGNKGARTAGVDGRTARSIEAGQGAGDFLGTLRSQVKDRSFRPLPVRERMIPKTGGKLRRLGISAIADRVVQASLKLVLEPIFEADFHPCSYGFRPNRRAHDAVAEVRFLASRSYEWIVEGDIKACFDAISHAALDEISHAALMERVRARVGDKRVLALVKAFLTAGILGEDRLLRENRAGTPQGSIITPPTQRAISASRPRWVTGGWSVAGERRAAGSAGGAGLVSETAWRAVGFRLPLDIICSIFLSCLGIAAQMPPSTRSMSTRPPGCWRPGSRRLRRPGCWPGGWAARSGRHAVTSPGLRNRAGLRSRTSPRCSRSGFPSGWPPRCGSTPGRPGAPSPRSPRRPWRSSSAALTGTIRRDEGAAGGGGIRLQPSRGGRNVSGLRHLGAAAAGQDRRPGGRRRKQ